ncbi:U-box domain-containing protein 12 [Seminavis robusta]|uniref:U-box domain-containing protein 12 n=1 Tax=Seminavis robusta TaxID=568900 RepID=A0A9N8HCG9_9STRA|nr:U-box domain-containing protein 12 [Seminavis robusta]|eukprot:Sro301_g112000.1 U-box domain-containing protein 12 (292) ;mRNA; r:50890-51862
MIPQDDTSGSINVPRSFICPLTFEAMVDPVIDSEGNTFERQALLHWLSLYGLSPVSRQPLNANLVVPNFALRDTIHEMMGSAWVAQRTEELAQQYPSDDGMDDPAQADSMDCSSSSHYSRSLSKYRGKMQCYLQKLSQDVGGGMHLELDDNGVCMFSCENMTIVIEVPEDVGLCYIYTIVSVPYLSEESKDMMLELNRIHSETRGGTLSLKKHGNGQYDIYFSYSDRIGEISAADFCNIVPNFIETALRLKGRLLGEKPQDATSSMDAPTSMSNSTQSSTMVGMTYPQKYL